MSFLISNLICFYAMISFAFKFLGFVLLSTALLKLWLLITDPFSEIRMGMPKFVIWITVLFELWLALQNFFNKNVSLVVFLNSVAFSVFAVVSGVRWYLGYTSCGCTGFLEIHPSVFFLFDLTTVVSIFLVEETRQAFSIGRLEVQRLLVENRSSVVGVIVGLLFAFALFTRSSDMENPVTADRVSLGKTANHSQSIAIVKLANSDEEPINVVGVTTSCVCVVLKEKQRFVLEPGKATSIPIVVATTKRGIMRQRVVFYLDSSQQSVVEADIFAEVF